MLFSDTGDISRGPGNRGPFGGSRRWRSGSQCSVHGRLCGCTASSSTGVYGSEGNIMKKQYVQKSDMNVVSDSPACILYFYILSLYRLSSRTLLVMEAVQQGKQWGERHASPTSLQQLSVTVQLQLSQCRPRLIQPSHRLEVSFTCQSPKNIVFHWHC